MNKLHNNLYVSGQISIQDIKDMAVSGIKTIINNRPDDEEHGQLNHQEAKKAAEEVGIAYHYLPMANGQPLPENLVPDFKEIIDNTDESVLVHCRSGMRSCLIWALGQIPTGTVSVDDAISAATAAGIPLANFRAGLESIAP